MMFNKDNSIWQKEKETQTSPQDEFKIFKQDPRPPPLPGHIILMLADLSAPTEEGQSGTHCDEGGQEPEIPTFE